jgi:hypothetical protein
LFICADSNVVLTQNIDWFALCVQVSSVFFKYFILISDVFSKQVAFHAVVVRDNVTIKEGETLICERVVYNAGGGYDAKTGVFTVPVSGLYCFLATATAGNDDIKVNCWVNLRLDDQLIANLVASGRGRTTAHAAVQAIAGQKVSLVLRKDNSRVFGKWNTTFSGFCICPDT